MRSDSVPFRELVAFAIGGGWGTDDATAADDVPVTIIRGTDFARVRACDFSACPRRFETAKRTAKRALRSGDIVLEISGGNPRTGQSTGRSVFIAAHIADAVGGVAIPASFCRRISIDASIAEPRFAYFLLQEMWQSGRARRYENQSTGISNFAFEHFLDEECVWLPDLDEQRRIVSVLAALDDKIDSNRRMGEILLATGAALVERSQWQASTPVSVGDVAQFHNKRRIPLSANERALRPGPFRYYGATGVVDFIDDYLFSGTYVLIGEDGTVQTDDGHPVVQYVWGDFWVNNHAHVMTFGAVAPEVGYLAMRHANVAPFVTGAVQPKLSMRRLKEVSLLWPRDVAALEAEIHSLFELYRVAAAEIRTLTELGSALLPKLISGKIRIPDTADADEVIGPAAEQLVAKAR